MRSIALWLLLNITHNADIVAQLYISPVIGWEFTKMVDLTDFYGLDVQNDKFDIQNPIFGIRLDYKYSDFNYISCAASFSQKLAIVDSENFIPPDRLKIDSYKTSVSYKRRINKFSLLGGIYADFLVNGKLIYEIKDRKDDLVPLENFQEYGLLSSVGFHERNLLFEMFCYYGLTRSEDVRKRLQFQKFISFGIQMSYSFVLQLKKEGKKVHCPTF